MKITPDLEQEMLAQFGRGMSSRAIAAWFLEAHGLSVSSVAIRRRLKETRQERGDYAKAVAREALSKQVLSDLEVLQEMRDTLREKSIELKKVDHDMFLKTYTVLLGVIDRRAKSAGLDNGNDEVEAMSDDKLRELARKAVEVLGRSK